MSEGYQSVISCEGRVIEALSFMSGGSIWPSQCFMRVYEVESVVPEGLCSRVNGSWGLCGRFSGSCGSMWPRQ